MHVPCCNECHVEDYKFYLKLKPKENKPIISPGLSGPVTLNFNHQINLNDWKSQFFFFFGDEEPSFIEMEVQKRGQQKTETQEPKNEINNVYRKQLQLLRMKTTYN